MSDTPIPITTQQAQSGISRDLRNNIYSALLSGPGIRNIEATLDESLRSSGFKDALRAYITELFRSGQATTCEEARNLAMQRIREQTRHLDGKHAATTNGLSEDHVNGNSAGDGGAEDALEFDLKIPKSAIDAGTKSVMKELEKVCEITYEDDK
jgi:mRNA-degrading endonuclease toxin of MazEF toxin-antitoxin module